MRKVKSNSQVSRKATAAGEGDSGSQGRSGEMSTGHADPDGTETIPAYECAPGCPVAALDEQSGELVADLDAAGSRTEKARSPGRMSGA